MGVVFGVVAGSVIGREHVQKGRNNQDGFAVRIEEQRLAAVVTDGCSSSRYSEVGARLGAQFLAGEIARRMQAGKAGMELAYGTTRALVTYLDNVARGACPDDREREEFIAETLLFGFLGLAIDGTRVSVFGVGDGVVSLNGDVQIIDPGPDNAPPYVGYLIMEGPSRGAIPELYVQANVEQVDTLLIGTDGLVDLERTPDLPLKNGDRQGGIDQFEADAMLTAQAGRLQRRLAVLGELNGRMRDDTTAVLVRRVR
ncbi:MAG: protein phosphatase 2C domain-containing protein [Myxococcales bacterium]|nr:protein phosphatase 2C domain-containing protein [Myxococcales bacterium]